MTKSRNFQLSVESNNTENPTTTKMTSNGNKNTLTTKTAPLSHKSDSKHASPISPTTQTGTEMTTYTIQKCQCFHMVSTITPVKNSTILYWPADDFEELPRQAKSEDKLTIPSPAHNATRKHNKWKLTESKRPVTQYKQTGPNGRPNKQ